MPETFEPPSRYAALLPVAENTNELFVGDADWFGSTTTKVSGGYAYFTAARKLGNNAEAALDIMPPYLAQNIVVRAL